MSTRTKKPKHDPNSIKSTTLLYFILLAGIILLLIWFLQSFFLNNYYERMMTREAQSTASKLEQRYLSGAGDFDAYARKASANNGVFIRIDEDGKTTIYDGGNVVNSASSAYAFEISNARSRLADSSIGKIAITVDDNDSDASRLVYATYLGDASDNIILYMVAPLYPVQSTVSILRSQLVYITVITILVTLFLAYVLSTWLSAPIESITRSAVELSQGNYNVKFNGGSFTETKELASTLNRASYEMQKTDSYQRDLIANVSHDLKTPLTMIRSYAEMINDISGDNPEKRKEHLAVIIAETERLNQLVTDILSVSQLQSNSSELHKANFNIVDAAAEVASTFEVLNEQEGYHISFSPCKATAVYGDRDKIKQVMTNFISNAVKYCGEDKVIRIELKRSGRSVRFDVIDHGKGIASDEVSHVWERYYRTSANRNRSIEGSGLGLSICKGILALHNADYGVKSEEGKGSDFWFALDIAKTK